jgi:hypothetical protein
MSERLATYLNDHLGGANAGVELARRLEQAVRDQPDGASPTNPTKQAEGWVTRRRSP